LLIVGLMPPAANPFGSGRSFLLEWLPKGAVGAEIGVWRGEFSKGLLRAAEPRELHLVDPWKFVPSFPSRWYGGMEAKSQADMDAIFAEVQDQFRTNPAVHILRKPSLEAAEAFPNGKFDWVYIDGDHSEEAVLNDLRSWAPKLKRGGLLVGDDFQWRDEAGDFSVRRAVLRFVDERKLPLKFVVNGQFAIQL
jgi:hypothetical protein